MALPKDSSNPESDLRSGAKPPHPSVGCSNLHTVISDVNFNVDDKDFDEEFEDEDISDDFTEAELRDLNSADHSDMTKQLLDFAVTVSADIQKYFGQRKEDDSCDIYENKWTSKKSGRELYLADILRIANGSDADEVQKSKSEKDKLPTGKLNKRNGLGPLDELFKDIQKQQTVKDTGNKNKKVKRLQQPNSAMSSLQERKLPASFWIEPTQKHGNKVSKLSGSNQTLQAPSTPDFSDLLDSWDGQSAESSASVTSK